MTDFLYWLGDLFTAFFDLFEQFGNLPNYGFILVGAALFAWWMKLQKDYSDKAEKEGTLK